MNETLYKFAWGNNAKRRTLFGRVCRVVARGKMSSVQIEFLDTGQREIVSIRSLRKFRTNGSE